MRTEVSCAPLLRREPIWQRKPIDEHFDDHDDEADFKAARRENSLAVDALDALGGTPRSSFDLDDTSAHTISFSASPESSKCRVKPPITSAKIPPTDYYNSRIRPVNGVIRRRSEFDSSGSSFLSKDTNFTCTTRIVTQIRKAGVMECPCTPQIALRDVRKVLEINYNAKTAAEFDQEIRMKVPAPSWTKHQFYNVIIKVEDRHYVSRISIRPTFADSIRVPGEEFDLLCSDIFFRLLQVRQVIRPYYS